MSSARFLLEFEATGDQEVVNAIKEVGTAGKETAADLDALKGIENPFTEITGGAGEAIAPIQDMGAATGDLTGIFAEAGTSSEEFGGALTGMNDSAMAVEGGLTEANTAVGDFGTSATTAGESATTAMGGIGQMSGAIVGLGGTIGTAISTIFRMQDAQLSLDKANFKVTKSTETARKASVAFDTLLKSATGNTAGITEARNKLSDAQDNLNKLQEAGVTSGAEYEAAQAAVTAATAALRAEFVAGGGDANKFDAAINKVGTTTEAQELATRNAEKATREFGQTQLETALAFAGFVGTAVQAVSSLNNIKAGAAKLAPLFKTIGTALTTGLGPIAGILAGLAIGFTGFIGIMTAVDQNVGGVKDALKGVHDQANQTLPALSGLFDHLGKTFESNTKGFGAWGAEIMKALGIPVAEGPKAAAGLKSTADATTALGEATVDTSAKLKGAMDATNGNTTAMGALQRTNAEAQITQEQFNTALAATKAEMDNGASSGDTLTQSMYKLYGAMAQTTEQALTLSNLFPQMGSNIDNALLGQKQGMDVAIQLWNDFRSRVEAGQYQVGEFTKYIQDMGYTLPPAIQAGVDKITEMSAAAEAVTVSSMGAAAGAKAFASASADLSSTVGKAASAVSDMNKSLVEQGYSLQASIAGLRDLDNQTLGVNNALLEVTNNFEKSNQALREAQAVRESTVASSEALHTALNNEMTSLLNEEAALKASIAASQSSVIQTQALSNAKLEGEAAARSWIAALDEEKASEDANMATLSAYASQFGELPGVIEPTADAMQGFIAANEQGGQAALDFAHQVSSAYDDMLGEAGGMVDELATIIQKGGDDMNENLSKWFEDLPEMVKEHLTDAQVAALQGIAEFQAAVNTTATEFEVDWMTQGFAQAKNDLSRNLMDMKKIFAKDFPEVFAVAQDIIAHGSEQAISKMVEIFKGAAKKPPQVILQELQALSGTIPGTLANAAGTMPGALDPAAAETGKSAAITLSEEFAAAGTHIAAVMKGIEQNMAITPPKFDVDVKPAIDKLSELHRAMNEDMRQTTVPTFNINVAPAIAALTKVRNLLGGVKSGQAGITINPAPAIAAINKVVKAIAGIRQTKIPQIQLNIQPAISAANKIRSIVNALPNIKRTITYTYRVVGSRPNPPNINKTITYRYRTVGSRPAQTGMHETLGEDTMIAAHKGERVDISPNTIYTNEERVALVPGGGSRKGGAEYVIPVTLMLDNKVLVRTVSRGLMEDVGGVS